LVWIFTRHLAHEFHRGCFQEAPHALVFNQQRLRFAPQRIAAAAGFIEKRGTLTQIALPRGVIELLNFAVTVLGHASRLMLSSHFFPDRRADRSRREFR
jgi:hypothetical protein